MLFILRLVNDFCEYPHPDTNTNTNATQISCLNKQLSIQDIRLVFCFKFVIFMVLSRYLIAPTFLSISIFSAALAAHSVFG
jgi:hypothetical protein